MRHLLLTMTLVLSGCVTNVQRCLEWEAEGKMTRTVDECVARLDASDRRVGTVLSTESI